MSALSSLKKAINDKRSLRIILPIAGIAGVAFVYTQFITDTPDVAKSFVPKVPNSAMSIQGANELQPNYEKALIEADNKRIEEARENHTSAMPTIRLDLANEEKPPVLEVVEVEPEQSIVTPEVSLPETPFMEQTPAVPIAVVPTAMPIAPEPADVDGLAQYLEGLRGVSQHASVSYIDVPQKPEPEEQIVQQVQPSQPAPVTTQQLDIDLPLAGTVLYGQLISQADSDAPGEILAHVAQGPLRGATLIGQFQVARNALLLSFNRMTVKTLHDGRVINKTVPINVVAVDTENLSPGMATSVDRHMFEKLGIGFLAGLANGYSSAISTSGQTQIKEAGGDVVTTSPAREFTDELNIAAGRSVATVGDVLMSEFGNRPTTIVVEAGTPLGLLFL
ncbi:TrbI/VirB10 family protein [Pseudovibrio ascidiaceicola]|uniref:DotG/IcmE/VirB10 family protein n=1 Tax=Pseudovibrio ascidiaceicola TaxID=285279 RepID=UPI003D35BE20